MTNSLKLSLLFVLLAASVQATQKFRDDLKSFVKGMLPVAAGLGVGRFIGEKIGHADIATLAGGALGGIADHYVYGGKQDPHYESRKLGNIGPIVWAIELICLKHWGERRAVRARNYYFFANKRFNEYNNYILSIGFPKAEPSRIPFVSLMTLNRAAVFDWITFVVNGRKELEIPYNCENEQGLLKNVTHIEKEVGSKEGKSFTKYVVHVNGYQLPVEGIGAEGFYGEWKRLQESASKIVSDSSNDTKQRSLNL